MDGSLQQSAAYHKEQIQTKKHSNKQSRKKARSTIQGTIHTVQTNTERKYKVF